MSESNSLHSFFNQETFNDEGTCWESEPDSDDDLVAASHLSFSVAFSHRRVPVYLSDPSPPPTPPNLGVGIDNPEDVSLDPDPPIIIEPSSIRHQ